MERGNLFNFSMLILRVSIGLIFIVHGAQKLLGMFGGVGLEGTAKMVEGLGVANAYYVALIWAYIEFIGGICLIMGILARWAALAVAMTVLISLWKVNMVYGIFGQNINLEYNFLMIGASLPVIFLGGGSWGIWDA
ncbi:MAG: DoxX family protein [Candidatus Omnitrophota bacterium]